MRDVIFSIESLAVSMDDIFGKLQCNVTSERKRLANIHQRLAVCQQKVKAFKGSKRPTTVFSTARFPGNLNCSLHPTVIMASESALNRGTCREVEDGIRYHHSDIRNSSVNNSELSVELQALLCRLHSCGSDIERVELTMDEQGLGPVPRSVSSVGSLLLFNSSTDPHKTYSTVDNLSSSERSRDSEERQLGFQLGSKPLASAPASLLLGAQQSDLNAFDLTFKPSQGVVAALALPMNLPLGFVADLQYTAISKPSAALSQPLSADQKRSSLSKSRLTNNSHSRDNAIVNHFPAPLTVGGSRSAQQFSPTSLHQPSLSCSSLSLSSSNLDAPQLTTPVPVGAISSTSSSFASISLLPSRPAPSSSSSSSSRALEGKGIEGSTDSGQLTGDTSKQKPGFLDAIRGMDASTLRSSTVPRLSLDAMIPDKKTAPVSMLDEIKERMRRRNSALTGKIDKEKQKRDQDIINAARDNNILLHLSRVPHPPVTPNYFQQRIVGATAVHQLTNPSQAVEIGNRSDDASDDSSVDAYSVSEVSFDDAPSNRFTSAVTRVTVPLLPSSLKAGVSPCMAVDALASVKATAPMDLSPSSMPYPYPGSVPRPKVGVGADGGGDRGAGGGGGGGGLLDDTRSSAVTSMLLSAKQKQSNVTDGSDDDWDQ